MDPLLSGPPDNGVVNCRKEPGHLCSVVSANPGMSCFNFSCELIMPWDLMHLSSFEHTLLDGKLCTNGLMLKLPLMAKNMCFCRPLFWQAHCHCEDRRSLQCQSGKVVMATLLAEFTNGAKFNTDYIWYREVVNHGLPSWCLYEGSITWRGQHFIYLKVTKIECLSIIKQFFNTEMGGIYEGFSGYYIVLNCKCCGTPGRSDVIVRSCARRTRSILNRIVDHLKNELKNDLRDSAVPCLYEPTRIRALYRLYRYKECTHSGLLFHF